MHSFSSEKNVLDKSLLASILLVNFEDHLVYLKHLNLFKSKNLDCFVSFSKLLAPFPCIEHKRYQSQHWSRIIGSRHVVAMLDRAQGLSIIRKFS